MQTLTAKIKNITGWDWIRILLSLVIVLLVLNIQPSSIPEINYPTEISVTPRILTGKTGSMGDLFADVVSARNILKGENPYVVLGPAFAEIGVNWDVKHPNTHPPTNFYFIMPLLGMSFTQMFTIWGWAMIILLFVSARLYGFGWSQSLLITSASLLWLPVALTFAQLNFIWIFGVALAYKFRNRNAYLAGVGIVIASFTKLLPALLLIPFLLKRRIKTLVVFIVAWLLAMGLAILMYHDLLGAYLEANKQANEVLLYGGLNSSLIPYFIALGRRTGPLLFVGFILGTLLLNKDEILQRGREVSTRTFMLFSWLAVALLPLAWPYSLTPLLFVFLYHLLQFRVISTIVTVICFILPCTVYSWGAEFINIYRICVLACGLLFLLHSKYTKRFDPPLQKLFPQIQFPVWK